MTIEQEILDLKTRVTALEKMMLAKVNMDNKTNGYINADIAGNSKNISDLTPWKVTKTAYIQSKSITFENVPDGNITVYFNPTITSANYKLERINDLVRVSFDPLQEVTEITLSVL